MFTKIVDIIYLITLPTFFCCLTLPSSRNLSMNLYNGVSEV